MENTQETVTAQKTNRSLDYDILHVELPETV